MTWKTDRYYDIIALLRAFAIEVCSTSLLGNTWQHQQGHTTPGSVPLRVTLCLGHRWGLQGDFVVGDTLD